MICVRDVDIQPRNMYYLTFVGLFSLLLGQPTSFSLNRECFCITICYLFVKPHLGLSVYLSARVWQFVLSDFGVQFWKDYTEGRADVNNLHIHSKCAEMLVNKM